MSYPDRHNLDMKSMFSTSNLQLVDDRLRVLVISPHTSETQLIFNSLMQIDKSAVLEISKSIKEAAEFFINATTFGSYINNVPDIVIFDCDFPQGQSLCFLKALLDDSGNASTEFIVLNKLSLNFNHLQIEKRDNVIIINDHLDRFNCVEFLRGLTEKNRVKSLTMRDSVKMRNKFRSQESTLEPNEFEIEQKYNKLSSVLEELEDRNLELTERCVIRILLIEDNPTDAKLITGRLTQTFPGEFEVLHRATLKDGLECLQSTDIDAIILDMHLPDCNGVKIIEIIRKVASEIPIIVLTGVDDSNMALEAMKKGAQDYVVKHFSKYGEILGRILRYGIERKKVERLMQHSLKVEQNILKEVLDEAPLFVIRFDNHLKIKSVNPAFEYACAMFGDEIIGKPLVEILPELDVEQLFKVVGSGTTFSLQQQRIESIGKNVIKDLYLDIIAWPTQRAVTGRKEGVLLCTDVSQQVNFNKQREEFIAALAHDIRNPLVGELRVLDAIAGGALGETGDAIKSALESIMKSNNSLLLMLSNMVDVYRLEANGATLHLERMDLGELTSKVISEMSYLKYGCQSDIVFSSLDQDCFISGDRTALSRVIQNLVYNAIKYAPSGSEILVSVTKDDLDNVILRVQNSGPKISTRERTHLFDRFERGVQGRRISHSSGFGLYLCKQIVDGHGGIIGCTSDEAETSFIVSIPKVS